MFQHLLFGKSSGDMLRILRPCSGLFCKMIAMGERLLYSQNSHGSQPQNTNSSEDEDGRYSRGEMPQVLFAFVSGHLSRLPWKALSAPFLFSENGSSLLQTGTFLTLISLMILQPT